MSRIRFYAAYSVNGLLIALSAMLLVIALPLHWITLRLATASDAVTEWGMK